MKPGGKTSQHSSLNSQLTRRVSVDFVFRRERVAVFVDGCFWHGCPKHGTMPAGNRAFWKAKLARNAERDTLVTRALRKAGWTVLRIWEHDLAAKHWPRVAGRIARALGRLAERETTRWREFMPRKIRQLVADLESSGFVLVLGGKGSHRKFRHARFSGAVILSGKDGEDAQHYQEKQVRNAIRSTTQ